MKPHTIKRPRKGKTSVRKLVLSENLRSHEGATVRETRRLTELLATHPYSRLSDGKGFLKLRRPSQWRTKVFQMAERRPALICSRTPVGVVCGNRCLEARNPGAHESQANQYSNVVGALLSVERTAMFRAGCARDV